MYRRTSGLTTGVAESSAPPGMAAGGFGVVSFKKFSSPLMGKRPERAIPPRKRARVSYKEGQTEENSDDENKSRPKKQKRTLVDEMEFDDDGNPLGEININKKYPIYEVKLGRLTGKFSVPGIKTSTGEIVVHQLSHASLGVRRQPNLAPRPLHDPMGDHAIVLYDPTVDFRETVEEKAIREAEEAAKLKKEEEAKKLGNGHNPHKSLKEILGIGNEIEQKRVKVPVVIDPRLSKVLRPHQIEGVKFLYRCATGLIADSAFGCIMADEMGLGKTLQCIALLFTLLKQSPNAGKGTIEKCIIACPSSLVKNWGNELVKWLGPGAISPLSVDGKGGRAELIPAVRRWVQARGRQVTLPVMIVSYETLRSLEEELASCEVGLMLCDEGHRLKNSESLTFRALTAIKCKRRVILTGTPVQNDLTEYFSLLNFANPDYLGTRLDFRKNYELAILRGRDADASDTEKEISNQKLKELGLQVNKFIIRRTNDLLSKYLPVKYEAVVFCSLSSLQLSLYNLFTSSSEIKKLLRGVGSQPLKAINILKKLCNHPDLLDLPNDLEGCEKLLPEGYVAQGRGRTVNCSWGGKFVVLERFLHRLRTTTTDKIVLISNYTQTLDLFEKMCRNNRYPCLRLDGTMNINKRQKLVDQFNDPEGGQFVFLLSSKAGGCGINLIGANRLILFDPDWNPASDQQALARVWRDGQKKECFVYRFISTGTIEEKVFQRQAQKMALSSCVVDENEDTERHFTLDSLRQLFTFNANTLCDTHDTFKCKRCKHGTQTVKAPALLYGDTSSWNHFTNENLGGMHDDLLRAELGLPEVSYVFQYISH